MSHTAAQHLARALARLGVRHAFGMPGGEVLPILDALRAEGVDFVLVRHEGSAGFMADAAWQLTGAPGVCVATLGPGMTNLVSGIAGAWLERSPVVAVTGQVESGIYNVYTHQTLDQIGLLRPVVRASVTLTAREAWREIPLTLRRMMDGRPAPVHLNVPADVAGAPQPGTFDDRFTAEPRMPAQGELARAAERIAQARRPILLVGPADRGEAAALGARALHAALDAPALATYRAKGVIDESDARYAGSFGLSPVVDRHQLALVAEADLVVLVGFDAAELRPQWLPGWPPTTPCVVIDAHPPVDLLCPIEALLIGPIGPVAARLAELVGASGQRSAWSNERLTAHQAAIAAPFADDPDGPATALRAVQRALPEDAIIALDVGAHRITASHTLVMRHPGRLLQSNGLASMGFGLPAAITAAIVRPDVPAVAITGDMGLWMALGELGIAAERGLNLIVAYFSDQSLALIELKQARMGLPRTGVRFANPAVGPLAASFGGVGLTVQGAQAIGDAVEEAQRRGGLTLLEIPLDPDHYKQQM